LPRDFTQAEIRQVTKIEVVERNIGRFKACPQDADYAGGIGGRGRGFGVRGSGKEREEVGDEEDACPV
jgi:hypothetical protein